MKEKANDNLMGMLKQQLSETEQTILQKWGRSLPRNELLNDRWERARHLGFGEGTSIYDSAIVIGNVTVGENTWIGPFTLLEGSGGLSIGSYCSISTGVQIYTHDSVKWALSGGKFEYEKAGVIIGNRCYLGPNVLISRGVSIGDGCIIGANSFVNIAVPAGYMAAGSPAKIIGKVSLDESGQLIITKQGKE